MIFFFHLYLRYVYINIVVNICFIFINLFQVISNSILYLRLHSCASLVVARPQGASLKKGIHSLQSGPAVLCSHLFEIYELNL